MKLTSPDVRRSAWGSPNGAQVPIVRIHAGRAVIAVAFEDIPKLLAELALLQHEKQKEERKNERT